jgi:molybdopterin molybdotransferase
MEMITIDDAYELVMSSAFKTGTETIPFTGSLNRILAQRVESDMDMPPFHKATVDGFTCRREDLGSVLEILETIAAGKAPEFVVKEKKCSRIMTGAAIPPGADMVFMVEDSELIGGDRVRFTGSNSKDNISYRGEDIKHGDKVLSPGVIIRPQDIAVLAAVGCTNVEVNKKPVVAVISSGDELVEPNEKPGISNIRNSNAYQLLAQIERAGASGRYMGIARDNKEQTYDILNKAIAESDVVLITGGVSMGDFDFIPSVIEELGVKILFSRINIQPGKPTTFGIHPDALVFGLPGNPVSSFIQFELLVRPLLCKMMGHDFKPVTWNLQFSQTYSRRSSDRLGLLPVTLSAKGEISVVEYHGSAHISALSGALGIITFPAGKKTIEKGEIVSVRQI